MTDILGVDIGLNVTGYANVRTIGAKRSLTATGVLCADKDRPWLERLDAQSSAFAVLIAERKPDAVAIENYVYQGPRSHNPQSLWLARLVGRCEGIARSQGFEYFTIDKSACNRAIGLGGKTDATRVQRMVDAMFPGPIVVSGDTYTTAAKARPRTEHEYDAVAVAVAGSQRIGRVQMKRPA